LAATDNLKSVMTPLPDFSEAASRLVYSVLVANKRTFEHAQSHPECKGMGSTLSAVLVGDRHLVVCNVGDSPVYLVRNGSVDTLSTPHTVMAEQETLAAGSGRPIDKQFLHMITRAMGVGQTVQPDVKEVPYGPGDAVVICSDGLSDKAFPEEIAEIVAGNPPQAACEALVALANERGGDDNITVIVVRLDPGTGAEAPASEAAPETTPAASGDADAPLGGHLLVEYDTDDASYTTVCRNLRIDGVFLETKEPFKEGEYLLLNITDPVTEEVLILSGVVSGRNPEGVDIAFEDLTPDQTESVKTLVRRL
jgi:serine/threonine protein phosphatase PrpC